MTPPIGISTRESLLGGSGYCQGFESGEVCFVGVVVVVCFVGVVLVVGVVFVVVIVFVEIERA